MGSQQSRIPLPWQRRPSVCCRNPSHPMQTYRAGLFSGLGLHGPRLPDVPWSRVYRSWRRPFGCWQGHDSTARQPMWGVLEAARAQPKGNLGLRPHAIGTSHILPIASQLRLLAPCCAACRTSGFSYCDWEQQMVSLRWVSDYDSSPASQRDDTDGQGAPTRTMSTNHGCCCRHWLMLLLRAAAAAALHCPMGLHKCSLLLYDVSSSYLARYAYLSTCVGMLWRNP